ncbi:MAG: hypothetical protein AB1813_10405, partial [Verrucomicrobiota bacterium]
MSFMFFSRSTITSGCVFGASQTARLCGALAGLLMTLSSFGALTVSNIQTVNVTPSSFSVLWSASEPGNPTLLVYSDEAGQ